MPATEVAPVARRSVLDLAPELGSDIRNEDREAARQASRGELLILPPGRWEPPPNAIDSQPLLGLMIASGMMSREVQLRDRHLLELLGAGDVLQLPVCVEDRRLGTNVTLTAVAQTELLVLGMPFVRAAARWPSLLAGIHRRLEAQRAELAVQALITHLRRAEHRLLLMLWHVADRWGVVTRDGIVVRLPLSHDILGQLTAARRPTVTLALGELEQAGRIKRLPDGFWLLTPAAEREVKAIASSPQTPNSLGEVLALRMQSSQASEEARSPHRRNYGGRNERGATHQLRISPLPR